MACQMLESTFCAVSRSIVQTVGRMDKRRCTGFCSEVRRNIHVAKVSTRIGGRIMISGSGAVRLVLASAFLLYSAVGGAQGIAVDDYTVSLNFSGALESYPPSPIETANSNQLGSLPAPPGFCCFVEALGIPAPFLFASVDAAPLTAAGGGAELTVYYEYVGPVNVYIPLVVTGTLQASLDAPNTLTVAPTGDSLAQIALTSCLTQGFGCPIGAGQANLAECFSLDLIAPCDQTVTGTLLHFAVLSNTEFGITYQAGVTLQNGSGLQAGGLATGIAEIDPVVSIDPSFADPQDFQLLVSNGIGNDISGGGGPSNAPEPSSSLLLLSGALAGLVARRRRVRVKS